jgi:hypothetical protein
MNFILHKTFRFKRTCTFFVDLTFDKVIDKNSEEVINLKGTIEYFNR